LCLPDVAYLVSGGLGGLGLQVARWLVERGARELVLLGRTGLPERSEWDGVDPGSLAGRRIASVRALEARGARVTVAAADVSDRDAMARLFDAFGHSLPPLRGVVHAAGVLFTDPVASMEPERFEEMLRPKVTGAWTLHELTRNQPLDFFVLFSSGASVWGSKGLGHYAAANHFLDALAHSRRAIGLPALSINWGWCAGGGMETPEIEAFFRRIGLAAMSPEQSLSALGRVLREGSVQEAVAAVDWEVFKPIYEVKRRRPLLEEIRTGASTGAAPAAESLASQLQALAPEERRRRLRQQVAREVARILGFDSAEAVDPRQGFFKLGMDSILSVQLRSRLEVALGRSLPPTVAFEYPTVEALGDYLLQLTSPTPSSPPGAAATLPPSAPSLRDDLSEDELEALLAQKLQRKP
jgi:NAD(P)-dependent dehydrogenase (short-subunit alcohol dehydrogenase family)